MLFDRLKLPLFLMAEIKFFYGGYYLTQLPK